VDEVDYYASQPWPFPASLMIGCFAHVKEGEIEVDPLELDAARWATREEIRRAVSVPPDSTVGFALPGSFAIAHFLIKAWSERSNT
jgi:NAD+ diphosphatase